MKKIKIFLLSIASSLGAMAADIDVTPGGLEGLLGEAVKGQSELRLRGVIDARDLAALEALPAEVTLLDLSGVSINSLTMPTRKYFGKTLFNAGEIPAYTFFKTGVKTLVLPAGTKAIGEGAFAGSNITEINVPEGVESLGDYAFYGCRDLTKVTLPSSLKSIGKGAFGNCSSLKEIDLSGATALTEIPERAFAGSLVLARVSLPQGVTKVGREAFSHTSITTLALPGVTEFEAYALSSMPELRELTISPDAEIGDGLLMDDISLASLTGLPEYVPDYFAANCSSLGTETANSASTLGRYSFANTLAPETLVLSGFVEKIERGALSGIEGLARIDVTALGDRVPEVDDTTFEGLNQPEIVLWVDDAAFDRWEGHPVWKLFQVKSTNQTGVDEITAETGADIRIYAEGGIVVVESPAGISDLRIYTPDGRMAYVGSPEREKVELEASSLPAGVVIVAATDGEGNARTASLLLR